VVRALVRGRDDIRILVPAVSSATGHFIAQRISAVMLVVLGLWFAIALSGIESMQHSVIAAFIAAPVNSILLAIMSATMAYHSYLGIEVVIDDYVHAARLNAAALLASRVTHLLVGLVAVYSIYRIGFGA
jgi:succinate dehydrogenase membrane anchor subunit